MYEAWIKGARIYARFWKYSDAAEWVKHLDIGQGYTIRWIGS